MGTVTLKKTSSVSDGAGGKIETPVTVGTYKAEHHLYSTRSGRFQRDEAGAGAGEGPGVQNNVGGYFNFLKPWPVDIAREYTITDADAQEWNVLNVRRYKFTLQVDVERLS